MKKSTNKKESNSKSSGITYEVIKELGKIEDPYNDGATMVKELNIIKWGDNNPKADIRGWNEDRTRMTKGITFNIDELKSLKKLLNKIDFDKLDIS